MVCWWCVGLLCGVEGVLVYGGVWSVGCVKGCCEVWEVWRCVGGVQGVREWPVVCSVLVVCRVVVFCGRCGGVRWCVVFGCVKGCCVV